MRRLLMFMALIPVGVCADPPKTAWGAPDLQGVWTTATSTPLERPDRLAGRTHLTDEEARALEARTEEAFAAFDKEPPPGSVGGYNRVWLDPGMKMLPGNPTSLIVDPPDGKIPWKPEARTRSDAEQARYGVGPYYSYLDLDTGERCISDGVTMAPLQPYNMNFQIFQTEDMIAINQEMYHEYRIIPLDGRPHIDPAIGQWLGDARGRWEGDTLVIESRRFATKNHYHWAWPWRASRAGLKITESLRRVDENTIDYRFTVEDPDMFTRSWTAISPMTSDQASRGVTAGRLYEYACHEGNYALANVLKGAAGRE
ncbi:MAG: hypothetical protein QF921_04285 [Pseudomonadales bacterium]|jgi:hypothetical protein|nr:hypothetical protein [Pseudomonadales bacterium]MDP6471065.1 hypothetical protein [Pseudomonadales bacterium]MDP6825749.1 hypothetical protein [Pseudomonadales bacterium]MDP6970720.1 hypothetical protein [Pseudomonadales bacterium]|tara:strand:+ start:446 stop:1384 length:939 start_codon:yes stop_codon:yes gene_type:complete